MKVWWFFVCFVMGYWGRGWGFMFCIKNKQKFSHALYLYSNCKIQEVVPPGYILSEQTCGND